MFGVEMSAAEIGNYFGYDQRTVMRWIAEGCPAVKRNHKWVLNSATTASWLCGRERFRILMKRLGRPDSPLPIGVEVISILHREQQGGEGKNAFEGN